MHSNAPRAQLECQVRRYMKQALDIHAGPEVCNFDLLIVCSCFDSLCRPHFVPSLHFVAAKAWRIHRLEKYARDGVSIDPDSDKRMDFKASASTVLPSNHRYCELGSAVAGLQRVLLSRVAGGATLLCLYVFLSISIQRPRRMRYHPCCTRFAEVAASAVHDHSQQLQSAKDPFRNTNEDVSDGRAHSLSGQPGSFVV